MFEQFLSDAWLFLQLTSGLLFLILFYVFICTDNSITKFKEYWKHSEGDKPVWKGIGFLSGSGQGGQGGQGIITLGGLTKKNSKNKNKKRKKEIRSYKDISALTTLTALTTKEDSEIHETKPQRDRIILLRNIISGLDKGDGTSFEAIMGEAYKEGMSNDFVMRSILELKKMGDLYESVPNNYRILRDFDET